MGLWWRVQIIIAELFIRLCGLILGKTATLSLKNIRGHPVRSQLQSGGCEHCELALLISEPPGRQVMERGGLIILWRI